MRPCFCVLALFVFVDAGVYAKDSLASILIDILDNAQKDAERRSAAASEERLQLGELREQKLAELERLKEVHGWITKNFDDVAQDKPVEISTTNPRVERIREIRKRVLDQLLNLPPGENAGRIWSGNGLNDLFEVLGPAALQHELLLRKITAENSGQESRIEERATNLFQLSEELSLPKGLLSQIQCQQGLTGRTLPVTLSIGNTVEMEILPLNWPVYLRVERVYQPHIDRITKARDQCLKMIGTGEFGAARELMRAVDDLSKAIEQRKKGMYVYTKSLGPETLDYNHAQDFVRTLRYASGRVIEMDRVPAADDYMINTGKRDDYQTQISLITVLAMMKERGLRFAKATRVSEAAHAALFESMRSYYVTLYSFNVAIAEQKKEITNVDTMISEAHETERLVSENAKNEEKFRMWANGIELATEVLKGKRP